MYLIGIVGRCYYNKDNQEIIQTHDALRKMLMKNDNCVCVTILPTEDIDYLKVIDGDDQVNQEKIDYVLDKCDAFIVPGGTYFYHFDEYVINYAIKHDKPLLAICLGFQALCSMFAKNRTNFDMTKRTDSSYHLGNVNEYKHDVIITKNTKLYNILNSDKIAVNSLHHDIINFDMKELIVNARINDVIEGVEYPGKKFIMGLQWHPEYLFDDNSKKIVNEFIKSIIS